MWSFWSSCDWCQVADQLLYLLQSLEVARKAGGALCHSFWGVFSPSSFLLPFLLLPSPSKAVNNRTGILSIWLEEAVPGDCHSSPRPPTLSSSAGIGCGAAALLQLHNYLAHHFLRKSWWSLSQTAVYALFCCSPDSD